MSVEINETTFPSRTIRNHVSSRYDLDHDGILTDEQIASIEVFDLNDRISGITEEVTTIAGLQYFSNLKVLGLSGCCNLLSLDASPFLHLEELYIDRCVQLSQIDISSNSNLKKISFLQVPISSIDFSNAPLLENINWGPSYNNSTEVERWRTDYGITIATPFITLTSLDVSNCPNLKEINYHSSFGETVSFTSISDLRNNPLLEKVVLNRTDLEEINLTGCRNLRELEASCLYLKRVYLDNCVSLTSVYLHGMGYNLQDSSEPLNGIVSANGCTSLVSLITRNSYGIKNIALAGCTSLREMNVIPIGGFALDALDLKDCENLEIVYAGSTHIANLNLGNIKKIKVLDLTNNRLSSIDLTNLKDLYSLNVGQKSNEFALSEIDISNNPIIIDTYKNGDKTYSGGGKYQYYLKAHDPAAWFTVSGRTTVKTGQIEITQQPESQTAAEGDNITLSVIAIGNNIVYQWEKKNNDSDVWVAIEDATSYQYIFNALAIDDGTTYRCFLRNEAESTYTENAIITVLFTPEIITQPQSITATEGRSCSFNVTAKGSSLSYQWQVSTDNIVWNDIRYATEPNYELLAAMSMNGYAYRCVVTNDFGDTTSDAATLTVIPDPSLTPPIITEQPSSQQVSDGNIATFSIVASGENLSYQWQTFKDDVWYSISGANAASYAVGASRLLNNAQYRCQVSNPIGSVYSEIVRLSVTSGSDISTPSIQIQPRSVTVADGTAAMFATSASGGSLYFQWQVKRNGQWYAITGATNSIYTVVARQSMNGEQYRCQITNSAGTVYTNIVQLTVQSSAPLEFYGYHSLIISGKNTYGEWEMYPTSRPHVAPPEVKTSYVDVPGANGGLDYTDLLTGDPRYGYRKGSWEFLLIPQEKWPDVYRSLCNFLHGKVHTVVLEDDPTWQYTGRLSVNQWQSAAHNSLITIDYILDPIPVNLEDETYDQDADDLALASRILRKSENEGKVIALVNNQAMLTYPENYFEDGDEILY